MSNDATAQAGRTEASITEDEAALYDRQIRLWGMEAQKRMRNAAVLVVKVKGVATEALKNIALAGVGSLIVVDGEAVTEEDLGAGFFFRDEDVGKNRAEVALPRIKSLNPLVDVEAWPHSPSSDPDHFESIVKRVDMVCVTDWDKDGLLHLNGLARQHSKPFYCGGSYGMLGYVFCDLLQHEHIQGVKKKEETVMMKFTTNYVPLEQALRHSWKGLNKRQTKELNPATIFSILALWKYQSQHHQLPESSEATIEMVEVANNLIKESEVNQQVLKGVAPEEISALALTANHELSPVCAVVGGLLGQDMLKALSGREPPIANFFTFDGTTSLGTVCRMHMP